MLIWKTFFIRVFSKTNKRELENTFANVLRCGLFSSFPSSYRAKWPRKLCVFWRYLFPLVVLLIWSFSYQLLNKFLLFYGSFLLPFFQYAFVYNNAIFKIHVSMCLWPFDFLYVYSKNIFVFLVQICLVWANIKLNLHMVQHDRKNT